MSKKTNQIQKTVNWAVVICEGSHVFCCVLPTVFSVLSLLVGFGLLSAMPGWLNSLHDIMHGWEVPMITLSGIVIAIGWGLHVYTQRMDCHADRCHHDHGATQKTSGSWILKAATLLFFINIIIYFGFHREGLVKHSTFVSAEISTHEH